MIPIIVMVIIVIMSLVCLEGAMFVPLAKLTAEEELRWRSGEIYHGGPSHDRQPRSGDNRHLAAALGWHGEVVGPCWLAPPPQEVPLPRSLTAAACSAPSAFKSPTPSASNNTTVMGNSSKGTGNSFNSNSSSSNSSKSRSPGTGKSSSSRTSGRSSSEEIPKDNDDGNNSSNNNDTNNDTNHSSKEYISISIYIYIYTYWDHTNHPHPHLQTCSQLEVTNYMTNEHIDLCNKP